MARNRYSSGHCLKSLARDGDKAGRRGGAAGARRIGVPGVETGRPADIAQRNEIGASDEGRPDRPCAPAHPPLAG